jgi:hypothetical protein
MEILATEEASGNRIPALASRWSCVNIHCSNKGNTCWQNKRGSETDRAEHHYPVNAHILLIEPRDTRRRVNRRAVLKYCLPIIGVENEETAKDTSAKE